MSDKGDILVLNAGSSSIKFAVFDSDLTPLCSGLAAENGTDPLGNRQARALPKDPPLR